jgi:hypothetical protein
MFFPMAFITFSVVKSTYWKKKTWLLRSNTESCFAATATLEWGTGSGKKHYQHFLFLVFLLYILYCFIISSIVIINHHHFTF